MWQPKGLPPAYLDIIYIHISPKNETNKRLNLGLYTGYLLVKLRLKVTVRKGARIESVPLKRLEKANSYKKKRWELQDGWLILDAY